MDLAEHCGFTNWETTNQTKSQQIKSKSNVETNLTPKGWGDERPWEQGWCGDIGGFVINWANRVCSHDVTAAMLEE